MTLWMWLPNLEINILKFIQKKMVSMKWNDKFFDMFGNLGLITFSSRQITKHDKFSIYFLIDILYIQEVILYSNINMKYDFLNMYCTVIIIIWCLRFDLKTPKCTP